MLWLIVFALIWWLMMVIDKPRRRREQARQRADAAAGIVHPRRCLRCGYTWEACICKDSQAWY